VGEIASSFMMDQQWLERAEKLVGEASRVHGSDNIVEELQLAQARHGYKLAEAQRTLDKERHAELANAIPIRKPMTTGYMEIVSPLAAERRAFWREAFIEARRTYIAERAAQDADAALAEFDKRFK
jgi:hypothetical protein